MYIFHSEISRIGMCTFLSGFFPICHKSMKKEIFIMRKEQITVTNNSVCNDAENKGGQFMDTTNAYYQWMTRNPYDIEECRSCVYLPACGGGCAGISYSHYGEYNKPGCYKVKSVFEKQIVNKFKGIIDEK